MKLTKTDSEGRSELELFQENESLLKELIGRVAQDFEDRDVDLEILEDHKISDALTEFIEPYKNDVQNDRDWVKLLNLAILAWNLSFFSKRQAQQEIEHMLHSNQLVSADTEKEIKEELKNILGQLIARKKRHFSSYKRLIIDFELKNQGDSFHLFVISLPMKHKFKPSR